MFYVAGGKIYSATFDEDLKVYPEMRLMVTEEGSYYLKKMTTGVARKPAKRQVCIMCELIAMFGYQAAVEAAEAAAQAEDTSAQ